LSLVKNSQAHWIASFLKYSPIEKFPNISKKVWCLAVNPTFSISFVRIDFCALTIFGLSGTIVPSKYFFNVATPLLIHNKLGSSFGTRETLFSTWCPFCSKKSKNSCLTSADDNFFILVPPSFVSFYYVTYMYIKNKKTPLCIIAGTRFYSRYHPNYELYNSPLLHRNVMLTSGMSRTQVIAFCPLILGRSTKLAPL